MSEPLFRGVLPALVTPFRNGAVDEDAFVVEHGGVIQSFTQAELPSRMERLHEYLGV